MKHIKSSVCVLVSLFLFSMVCEANSTWSFKKKYWDTSIYISSNNTRLVLDYHKNSSDNKKITKEFIKNLEETKKKMLSQMEISQWKLTKSNTTQVKKGVKRVLLSGSYVNSQGEKTYFTEYHFYGPSKKLQLLLTNENKKRLNHDALMANFQKFVRTYEL